MLHIVYLDESGDLGWTFSFPYRTGGSSRFLTLAYLIIPEKLVHLPTRLVKSVYNKYGYDRMDEHKGHQFSLIEKEQVSNEVVKLLKMHPDLILGAITVNKTRVQDHIRSDPNKLYNYMMKLSILPKVVGLETVKIIGDERNIKVANGRNCVDYLQTTLWFELNTPTVIEECQQASHKNKNLIFIDWIANIVWSRYEDNSTIPFNVILPFLKNETLFFR